MQRLGTRGQVVAKNDLVEISECCNLEALFEKYVPYPDNFQHQFSSDVQKTQWELQKYQYMIDNGICSYYWVHPINATDSEPIAHFRVDWLLAIDGFIGLHGGTWNPVLQWRNERKASWFLLWNACMEDGFTKFYTRCSIQNSRAAKFIEKSGFKRVRPFRRLDPAGYNYLEFHYQTSWNIDNKAFLNTDHNAEIVRPISKHKNESPGIAFENIVPPQQEYPKLPANMCGWNILGAKDILPFTKQLAQQKVSFLFDLDLSEVIHLDLESLIQTLYRNGTFYLYTKKEEIHCVVEIDTQNWRTHWEMRFLCVHECTVPTQDVQLLLVRISKLAAIRIVKADVSVMNHDLSAYLVRQGFINEGVSLYDQHGLPMANCFTYTI